MFINRVSPEGRFQFLFLLKSDEQYFSVILFSRGFELWNSSVSTGFRLITLSDRALHNGGIPQFFTIYENVKQR